MYERFDAAMLAHMVSGDLRDASLAEGVDVVAIADAFAGRLPSVALDPEPFHAIMRRAAGAGILQVPAQVPDRATRLSLRAVALRRLRAEAASLRGDDPDDRAAIAFADSLERA